MSRICIHLLKIYCNYGEGSGEEAVLSPVVRMTMHDISVTLQVLIVVAKETHDIREAQHAQVLMFGYATCSCQHIILTPPMGMSLYVRG